MEEKDRKKKMTFRSYPGVILDLKEKKLPVIDLPLKPGTKYAEVIFMGDFHVGSDGFSEHQLLAYINWIKSNPHVRVVLMGDLVEVGDLSRYLPAQQENFKRQIRRLIEFLHPIKDQIICILEGNHEERYAREVKNAIQFSHYLALELGIAKKVLKPGPQKGQMMVFKVKDQYYSVYAIHGSTGAIFHKGTQLRRMAFGTKCALIAHGHTHSIYHDHYIYRSVNRVDKDFYESIFEQHWLVTGCFVKYLGYAEQKSYPMTKIGAPIVRFSGEEQGMMIITDALFFYGIGRQGNRESPSGPWARSSKSAIDQWLVRGLREQLGIASEKSLSFLGEILPKRPSCPRCGSNHVISRGIEWGCAECGRRWRKKSRWGRDYEKERVD